MALDCLSLENDHVYVDHIDPGVIDTDMQRKIRKSKLNLIRSEDPKKVHTELNNIQSPDIAAKRIIQKIIGS